MPPFASDTRPGTNGAAIQSRSTAHAGCARALSVACVSHDPLE